MTVKVPSNQDHDLDLASKKIKTDPILCPHCLRTASNGIKCQGICVADSGY